MITTTTAHKCNKDVKANESLLPDLASSHSQRMNIKESSNESISITQITTTQTSQPQKRETGQAQQTRDSCNGPSLSKYTQLARVTGTSLDT